MSPLLPRAGRGPALRARWHDSPTVALQGDLDFSKREAVAATLRPAERMKRVTLDLRAVTCFDASTLGCFIHLRIAMGTEDDHRIRLIGYPYHARLLRIVEFERFFEILECAAPVAVVTGSDSAESRECMARP